MVLEKVDSKVELEEICSKVQELLDKEHLYAGVYTFYGFEDLLIVDIEWGDWKHDHGRADWLIEENFNLVRINCVVYDEDGSDCYSAKHYYRIKGYLD